MCLFGPGQVILSPNIDVKMQSRKEFALLAYLTVESNRAHSRESLMGLLWPELGQDKARNNLRVILARLRKTLDKVGIPLLATDHYTIRFDGEQTGASGAVWLDIAEFDRLLTQVDSHQHIDPTHCSTCRADMVRAIDLYQAEFLQGFYINGCEVFEHWQLIQRERLHMRIMGLFPPLESAYMAEADWQAAEKIIRHHLALDPLDESAHRSLMQLLALTGLRNAALTQYEFCCRILMEELDVEPDDETVGLADQIREGDLRLTVDDLREARASYAESSNGALLVNRKSQITSRLEPLPNQILFGVDKALETVGNAISAAGQSWLISIDGIGGQGKTTLAHRLVEQLMDALPETAAFSEERAIEDTFAYQDIAWVSAKQEAYLPDQGVQTTGRAALDDESLIDQLLAQLADGPYPTGSSQEKRMALTQLLNEKPSLVVIDNLETAIDYQSLLPLLRHLAKPSKFLITSRMSLATQGDIFCYSLSELSETDAIALLRHEAQSRGIVKLAAAQDKRLFPIYETVGGNPLALKLVIGQLQFLPLKQVLESLQQADTQRVDQFYSYIYWQAWQMLGPTSRHLWLSLPVVPNATFAQLLTVSGLEIDDLQRALMHLHDLSLVEIGGDLDEPHYRLHRLTETFLMNEVVRWHEPALQTDSAETQYFIQRVLHMVKQWHETEAVHEVDIAILDRDYESVVKAISLGLALNQGWTTVKPLIIAFTPFMERRGHWHRWHSILERAIDAARQSADLDGEITLTALLARLCQRESRPKDVIYYYRRVIHLARRSGNRFEEARACSNLGYAYIDGGQWWRSEILSCHALALFEKLESEHGRAHTHNHLGLLYIRRRLWEEAERHLKCACELWENMGDEFNLIYGYNNLSALYIDKEDSQNALLWSKRALQCAEQTGEVAVISLPLTNIGAAYYQSGEFEEAETYLQRAENVYRSCADTIGLARIWNNFGRYYTARKLWRQARHYFQESLKTYRTLSSWDGEIKALMNLVQLELNTDNPSIATVYINEIEQIAQQHIPQKQREDINEQLNIYRLQLLD